MIEVSGLIKTYGNVKALDDVSFKVGKGQIVGFLGANGAGKTTTMDILCGCIGADQGKATICGFDITENPIEAKQKLGYLPDEPPLHLEMRVGDFIDYAAKLRGLSKEKRKERLEFVLDKLEITDVAKRVVGNLSKGYRQRVAMAQAIVHDPEVLILDEPTEGLDPTQIAHIRELIRSLAPEHTIMLSSHILTEVQNTCDQIIIIHQGKIVKQGSYEDLVVQAGSGDIYRLKVSKNTEQLCSSLSSMSGVAFSNFLQDENSVEFGLEDGDQGLLDTVAKAAIDGGHGLRELSLKTRSLEDAFFQITK
jgi:ABC-2 type transport system ATP-binding protein